MAAAFCDKLMAYDVAPEEWRKLDVRVGDPAAGEFCDNSIKTYKYNPISWLPKSLFEQMRRLANQFFLVMGILMAIGTLMYLIRVPAAGAEKGDKDGSKPTSGDAYVAGFSLAGLFDCKRAEQQVSHKDLTQTMAGIDSPGRLGVQDSDQAQAAGRYNYDHAAEKSFYAPKTPNMPKKNVSA